MSIDKTVETVVNRVVRNAKRSIVKKEVIQKERINFTKLKEIHITTSSLDIEVKSHVEEYIDIVLESYEDGPQMKINQSDNCLEVTTFKPTQRQTFFGVFPSTRIQLFVPTTVADTWDVRTGSGDVSFSNVMMKALSVNSGSGDIDLAGVEAGQVKLRCASGDIETNNMKAETCYFSTSSGEMAFRKLIAINVTAEVSSGSILFSNLHGENLDLQLASGDVELKDINIVKGTIVSHSGEVDANHVRAGMLLAKTRTGDIDINDFTGSINGSVVSGDLSLHVKGERTVNLDAKSGDISVELENEIGLNATVDFTSNSDDIITNLPLAVRNVPQDS